MACSRPCVSVYGTDNGKIVASIKMPSVFLNPIRCDIVRFVHLNMSKNSRQAYGVALNAGYQTSAASWGTGRAVSRIPRVPGGGTHRAGQAAFGNMCRGGGMFAPNKTWRKWHRKINLTQKRHALASAVAATAIPALVMAKGHRIDSVKELPLVISEKCEEINKTKKAYMLLKSLGLEEDLQKVIDSKKLRSGKGKSRNRRFVKRKGPLIVYKNDSGIVKGFRNIPGVDICHVDRLNLLKIAPGGNVGRLTVYTSSAFGRLSELYGSVTGSSTSVLKKGYHLQRPMMTNADLARVINSDEIQSQVRPALKPYTVSKNKFNPLKNKDALYRLNPASSHINQLALLAQTPETRQHTLVQHQKRKRIEESKASRKRGKSFIHEFRNAFETKYKAEMGKTLQETPTTVKPVYK